MTSLDGERGVDLNKVLAEIESLREVATNQNKTIDELKAGERLRATQPQDGRDSVSQAHVEKPPLPPKYDGTTNFDAYMVQFDAIATAQHWQDRKVLLLSRLKGKALDVAAQEGTRV